uniref:Uncharacterized protein n=1 Tax=Caenorhabditis tropicalis TaxID=1561998 RepID=A0A1I7UGH0_9PELO
MGGRLTKRLTVIETNLEKVSERMKMTNFVLETLLASDMFNKSLVTTKEAPTKQKPLRFRYRKRKRKWKLRVCVKPLGLENQFDEFNSLCVLSRRMKYTRFWRDCQHVIMLFGRFEKSFELIESAGSRDQEFLFDEALNDLSKLSEANQLFTLTTEEHLEFDFFQTQIQVLRTIDELRFRMNQQSCMFSESRKQVENLGIKNRKRGKKVEREKRRRKRRKKARNGFADCHEESLKELVAKLQQLVFQYDIPPPNDILFPV